MDRDLILLGIKYEAAKLGGVDELALAKIEEQVAAEAGEGWRSNPAVAHGRDAVRAEHGLPTSNVDFMRRRGPKKRPLWRKILRV